MGCQGKNEFRSGNNFGNQPPHGRYSKLGVENRTAAVMRMIKFIKLSAIYFVADFCSDLTFFSAYL